MRSFSCCSVSCWCRFVQQKRRCLPRTAIAAGRKSAAFISKAQLSMSRLLRRGPVRSGSLQATTLAIVLLPMYNYNPDRPETRAPRCGAFSINVTDDGPVCVTAVRTCQAGDNWPTTAYQGCGSSTSSACRARWVPPGWQRCGRNSQMSGRSWATTYRCTRISCKRYPIP